MKKYCIDDPSEVFLKGKRGATANNGNLRIEIYKCNRLNKQGIKCKSDS